MDDPAPTNELIERITARLSPAGQGPSSAGPGLWPEVCIAPGLFCETMDARNRSS